jgi:hypothetical protein
LKGDGSHGKLAILIAGVMCGDQRVS